MWVRLLESRRNADYNQQIYNRPLSQLFLGPTRRLLRHICLMYPTLVFFRFVQKYALLGAVARNECGKPSIPGAIDAWATMEQNLPTVLESICADSERRKGT